MHDVLITGGGPVGLYLGVLLRQAGLDVRVLEQRTQRSAHSRAIGIHPPAIAALERIGAAAPLLARGVAIRHGLARSGGRDLAGLSFARAGSDHPYVLAVPQSVTEAVLEERLHALGAGTLVRGARVLNAHDDGSQVTVHVRLGATEQEYTARILIAADGARSVLREQLGIRVSRREYPDSYLMGDFQDGTGDGATAVLHLEPGGIVESFPLPGGVRRWVVHTRTLCRDPGAQLLAELILDRTGAAVDPGSNSMLSAFEVRARLAHRLVRGRVALIGDAAHEISPIGGQGMNLGWLDAVELAPIIVAALTGRPSAAALAAFERNRRRAVGRAVRQSHLNMVLGRPLPPTAMELRNRALVRMVAAPGVHDFVARRFTMQ